MVLRGIRADLRLVGGLVMIAFVVCHFINHALALGSLDLAMAAHAILIGPWRTEAGTGLLLAAGLTHYGNALWSIHRRRSLRLQLLERWQLGLGLAIPALVLVHLTGTRLGEEFLGLRPGYPVVLLTQWVLAPWKGVVQALLVLVVWGHACVGLHLRLRIRPRYRARLPWFAALAVAVPTLALAGWVAAGGQVMRASSDPAWVTAVLTDARFGPRSMAEIGRMLAVGLAVHAGLSVLPFLTRLARRWGRPRQPLLTLASGRDLRVAAGASLLEALRDQGIPHASVCGGKARCTTCRVRVLDGLEGLPAPTPREVQALARIGAPPEVRLACQLCPTADLTVMPLLPADATLDDVAGRGGLDGRESVVTVVFVDLRGSTALGEAKMPYDVLFILNRFFLEMSRALAATGGHYSNFTGDGLMALYGLDGADPNRAARDALAGAGAMLAGLARINQDLANELPTPLRIGIGIHAGEAIVGSMGPPGSQITSAIGDTVNIAARLEGLSKDYGCPLVVSKRAADLAGLILPEEQLRPAVVRGRAETVMVYALDRVPD